MNDPRTPQKTGPDLVASIRAAGRQEQFLEVVSAEEATRRFHAKIDLTPLGAEDVELGAALGRVLAHDVVAGVDAPPFDRSNVDGFAVRSADTVGATEASPKTLTLNHEVIACGHVPFIEVRSGTATTIATGGVIPRGADAVVMIEQTELIEAGAPAVEIRRAVAPGQFVSYAGSDIARGETLLRRGTTVASREIGMLAACGLSSVAVVRRPKVAVLSTGDELVAPGRPLKPASVYDSNGAIIAAAVTEACGEPVAFGAFADDEAVLERTLRTAIERCDMVVLSGGTSKGAGDLSHRVVSRLGAPGILVHGVALKPGKPLCLAAIGDKPVIVLPGFPTSAIFTFHAYVAPVIRARAGLPAEVAETVKARVPVRITSELGRKEFALVALVPRDDETVAFPTGKGSGSVTSFSQADGFIEIAALATSLDANTEADVTLIGGVAHAPDFVIMGSHDIALDVVIGALSARGFRARVIAVGSQGGVSALKRGECHIAPVHLVDPETGHYNKHLADKDHDLVPGWRRSQGIMFRKGDVRFDGKSVQEALASVLMDTSCVMVNRNAGSGTRVLIDKLLNGARPPGYSNQPKSHNAVAVSIAQKRSDWGVGIEPVAHLYGLDFMPVSPEHFDFLVAAEHRDRLAVKAFLEALEDPKIRKDIAALGMSFAD